MASKEKSKGGVAVSHLDLPRGPCATIRPRTLELSLALPAFDACDAARRDSLSITDDRIWYTMWPADCPLLRAPIPRLPSNTRPPPKFARGGASLACLWAYQSRTAGPPSPPRLLTLSFLLPSRLWPYSLPHIPDPPLGAPLRSLPARSLDLDSNLYSPPLSLPSPANCAPLSSSPPPPSS